MTEKPDSPIYPELIEALARDLCRYHLPCAGIISMSGGEPCHWHRKYAARVAEHFVPLVAAREAEARRGAEEESFAEIDAVARRFDVELEANSTEEAARQLYLAGEDAGEDNAVAYVRAAGRGEPND